MIVAEVVESEGIELSTKNAARNPTHYEMLISKPGQTRKRPE
jgi:hypothetical protein